MSDTNATPNDNAIEQIDEHVRQLDADIAASSRKIEVDHAIRERLMDLRGSLSRKPRARRVRAAEPAAEGQGSLIEAQEPAAATEPAKWAGFSVVPSEVA